MEADIVDRIYEAAVVPELWESVLHDLSVSNGYAGGVLFTVNDIAQRGIASPGVKDIFDVFMREGWATRSERALRSVKKNHAGFVRDADLFTEQEENVDPLHVELMRPAGFGDVAGTVVQAPNGDFLALSFERSLAMGRTPDVVINTFDQLRPHFARAATISGRVDIERSRTQVATLSALGLPGAVVSGTGRAIAVNEEFGLLSAQIYIRARDIVTPRSATATKLFLDALSEASHGRGRGRSIPLPRVEAAPPSVLHVVPVRGNGRDVFPNASFLLVVTSLGAARSLSPDILSGLFDLTAAEAKVAAAVLRGLSPSEIAEVNEVSPWTVRNQLARVFAKTGVTRQSELVSLCAGGLDFP